MDDDTVTFSVKDYRNEGQVEGTDHFRCGVCPAVPHACTTKAFCPYQALWLLCSRTKNQKLTLCRNLLGCKKYLSKLRNMEMPEVLEHLYGIKVCVCKACGGHLGKPQMKIPLRC